MRDWAVLGTLMVVCGCGASAPKDSAGGTGGSPGAGGGGTAGSGTGVGGGGGAVATGGTGPGGTSGLAGSTGGTVSAGGAGPGGAAGAGGKGAGGTIAVAGAGGSMGGAAGSGGGRVCLSKDINISATTVSGTVTINGVAITDASKGTASVTLHNDAGDFADLAQIPGSSYSALVAPGTFDVYFHGESGDWGSAVPIGTTVKLQSGFVVGATPLSLNLNIPTTTVTTTVTLNGATLATSTTDSNGYLELRKATGESALLASILGGNQRRTLVPGTYDLYYAVHSRSAERLPTNTSARLQSGIVVGTSPLSLKIDVPVTTVSATVTVGGAALTGVSTLATFLTLKNDAGDSAPLTLTSTSGASSGPLIPGTYDLYYSPDGKGAGLPGNRSTKLQSGIVVGSSPLSLKVDLPATTVSGKLTINGAAPSGLNGGEALALRGAGGDTISIAPSATGAYSALVIAGTYDLAYTRPSTAGAGAPANGGTTIRTGIVVGSAPLTLDVDVPATTVSGSVTVNGAKLTGSAPVEGEGSVFLASAAGDWAYLSSLHASSFSALVVPGTYGLYYVMTTAGTAVPSNKKALLRKGIVVGTSPLTLNVDVPAATVSGTVKVNGAVIPDPAKGVGVLTLYGPNDDTAQLAFTSSSSTDPAAVAAGAYSALVVPGSYELYYRRYNGGSPIPGNGHADLGCFTVP